MGKLETFEIFLDSPGGVVEAGGVLYGQLVIETLEDMDVTEITVQCFGKCRVQWLDARGITQASDLQIGLNSNTLGEEVYINEAKVCFPPDYESEDDLLEIRILPRGQHVYDFHFHLPDNIPSTVSSELGYVRYLLRAVIERPCKTETNIRSFSVVSPYDLNMVSDIDRPVQSKGRMEVGSILRRPGVCKTSLKLAKRGYVPGETITANVNIYNDTCQDIKRAFLTLKMVTDYKVASQKFATEEVLVKTFLDKVCAGETLDVVNKELVIPEHAAPSHLHGCSFMHTKYYVELHIKVSLLSLKKLKTRAKLEVGTVAVDEDAVQAYCRLFGEPPRYEDLPPSYDEALAQMMDLPNQSESQTHCDIPKDTKKTAGSVTKTDKSEQSSKACRSPKSSGDRPVSSVSSGPSRDVLPMVTPVACLLSIPVL